VICRATAGAAAPNFFRIVRNHLEVTFLKQGSELIHCQTNLTNDGSQCSFGYFVMVGNHDPSVRVTGMSQHNVASSLVISLISEFDQGAHYFAAGKHG